MNWKSPFVKDQGAGRRRDPWTLTFFGTSLATVRHRIAEAARRSGRSPEAVTLVVVTKRLPVEVSATTARVGGGGSWGELSAGALGEGQDGRTAKVRGIFRPSPK